MDRERMQYIVRRVRQLPTLPVIVWKVEELIRQPHTTAVELGAVVERDQALTARVLKMINSSLFGFPEPIASVERAIVLLGFEGLKQLVLSSSVIETFEKREAHADFDHEGFWRHSLAVAVCSRILALKAGPLVVRDAEEAFTAGLIHDIGKLVEDQFMRAEMREVLALCRTQPIRFEAAERRVLGFTHFEIGGALAEHWKLPVSLAGVIRDHHQPARLDAAAPHFPLVAVVHVADLFVKAMAIGWGGDEMIPALHGDAWACLRVGVGQVEAIWLETDRAYREMADLLLTRT